MKRLFSLALSAVLLTSMFLVYTKGESVSEIRKMSLFTFYYPWYATPNVSGYWFHWNDATHNPDNFLDGRRQIAATRYPLLDVYDSNNESLIERHVDIARKANIDGFVASWWGRNSFEDGTLLHIKNVCERKDFKFTIYYETTFDVSYTVDDILYLLNKYSDSNNWYKIDGRPVIYVYNRAVHQLNPQVLKYWRIDGNTASWILLEDVREPPRCGIFVIEPHKDGIGYVESGLTALPLNETYSLRVGISDMKDDCPPNSDVGFRIKIKGEDGYWETLDDLIVNYYDGWLDLTYDVSSYAGQSVTLRVESYDGGVAKWCSEWAAVDYMFIMNSRGEILNQGPYFDNEWKTVVETLKESGHNPYFIIDFAGYEHKIEYFAEYFLNFTDGIHTYDPATYLSMSDIYEIYSKASDAAHSKNKTFVATVVPGYDDRSFVVDRQNGSYYNSFWSVAKSSFPDEYIITSFNEWYEGTEIEPSLEYCDLYINLTCSNTLELLVHDVAIENVSASKTVVGQGLTTSLKITVVNHGDCIENSNVTVYANIAIIGIQTFNNLAHGTKTTLHVTWNATGVPLGNYPIKAYAWPVPGETDTTNNNFTDGWVIVAMVGDITGPAPNVPDGKVDMRDVAAVARLFGIEYPDPKYDPNCDITGPASGVPDGKIDMRDVSLVAKEFGKTA